MNPMRPQGAEGGAQQGTDAGTAGAGPIEHVDIDWAGQRVGIEHQWIHRDRFGAPLVIFLHEGLGSVRMWKDFPARLCDALGWRGLVYSRVGYGGSRLYTPEQAWGLDFMHRQAHEVLPALLDALGIDPDVQPPWLIGHSDGGSIALLYAARYPRRVAGLVVMAPHIVVEDLSVASSSAARRAYLETDLRERLAKYHDDPDRAFWRWNDIWLHPPFREWSIEQEIETIRWLVDKVPLLLRGRQLPLHQLKGLLAHEHRDMLLEMARLLTLGQGAEAREHFAYCQEYLSRTPAETLNPPPLLNGADLIALGLKPGHEFSQLLEQVRHAQLDEQISQRQQAIEWINKHRNEQT